MPQQHRTTTTAWGVSVSIRQTRRSFVSPLPPYLPLLLFLLLVSASTLPAKATDAEAGGDCIDDDSVKCPFWASEGECQKNQGYMLVHCKKSCHQCTEKPPPPILPPRRDASEDCFDANPEQCPAWAAGGECQKNTGYMHVHCKKSCNRCHIDRMRAQIKTNRFQDLKKREIEELREQHTKSREDSAAMEGDGSSVLSASAANARAASARPATHMATATISADGTIVETTLSGSDAAKPTPATPLAEATTTTTATTTTRTQAKTATTTTTTTTASASEEKPKPRRKKAKIDAQTGLECVDLDDSCPLRVSRGECKSNRSYTSVNCRLSCDRCHIVRVNSQDDIRKHIDQRTRETEKERAARKQAREAIKILQGEM